METHGISTFRLYKNIQFWEIANRSYFKRLNGNSNNFFFKIERG